MILKSCLVEAAVRLSKYASNDEPLAAAGNKVALVLAGNTPLLSNVRGRPGRKRGYADAAHDAILISVFCDGPSDLASLPLAWQGDAIFGRIDQYGVLHLAAR